MVAGLTGVFHGQKEIVVTYFGPYRMSASLGGEGGRRQCKRTKGHQESDRRFATNIGQPDEIEDIVNLRCGTCSMCVLL